MFLVDLEKVNAQVGIGEALINTVIALATVFVVLILISVIIYLLQFVPKIVNRVTTKQTVKQEAPKKQEVAPQPTKEAVVTDDGELVAVITAAVAAMMTEETGVPVPADGLLIRSIKRRTLTK